MKEHWVKVTPYGDYNETTDRVNSRTNRNTHILREALSLSVSRKHRGSKPIGKLLKSIARAHEVMKK